MAGTTTRRTCLVTGASSGIGLEITAGLAARGDRVLMACRCPDRAERAADLVRRRLPGADLDIVLADLAGLAAVRRLVDEVGRRTERLDLLVSNAALFSMRRQETEDGLELTFAVNHLAPFVLVRGLLELLRKSAPARVVVVSSSAHARGTGRIAFDDLQARRRYSGWRAYCQSKLGNLLFTLEASRRWSPEEVTVNAVHPGVVATKLLLRGVVRPGLAARWIRTAEEGAVTPLFAANAVGLDRVTGQYLVDCRRSEPSDEARDRRVAERLWKVSERLANTT